MDPVDIKGAPSAWTSMRVGDGPAPNPMREVTMEIRIWEPGGSLHTEIGTATRLGRAGVSQLREICGLWLEQNPDELQEEELAESVLDSAYSILHDGGCAPVESVVQAVVDLGAWVERKRIVALLREKMPENIPSGSSWWNAAADFIEEYSRDAI